METKICTTCHQDKPLSEFHRKKKWLRDKCKECSKAYHREHYLKNKERYKSQAKDGKKRLRGLVDELKSVPCADCGRSFPPIAMDFHHRQKKLENIARMIADNGLRRLMEEINKCVVLCAVCHRIRHDKSGSRPKVGQQPSKLTA
jgi:hypothetical protein